MGSILIYKKYYYSTHFYTNNIYEYFIENTAGIIIQKTSYVTFDDIKALGAKKYPFTDSGSLTFDVSGDTKIQYGNSANHFQVVNNVVKVEFVKNLFEKLDTFDTLLNNHHVLDTQVEVEKKQDLGNSMIMVVFASLLAICISVVVLL